MSDYHPMIDKIISNKAYAAWFSVFGIDMRQAYAFTSTIRLTWEDLVYEFFKYTNRLVRETNVASHVDKSILLDTMVDYMSAEVSKVSAREFDRSRIKDAVDMLLYTYYKEIALQLHIYED